MFKQLAVALAAAAAFGAAHAVTYTVALNPGDEYANTETHLTSTPGASFWFEDTYNFTFPGTGTIDAVANSMTVIFHPKKGPAFDSYHISNLTLTLYDNFHPFGVNGRVFPGDDTTYTFTLNNPSGQYHIDVDGYVDGKYGGVYGLTLDVAAAVPEPETYALMLAGLGAVGFMMRRRQRS